MLSKSTRVGRGFQKKVAGFLQHRSLLRQQVSNYDYIRFKSPGAVLYPDATDHRTIRYKCAMNNTIGDVLRQRPGWVESKEGEDWDFYWCDVGWLRENFDHIYMEEHVRICHFRNHYELTRKNLMVKNLKRLKKQLERESKTEAAKCDFFPTTYELPVAKSQGKGIFLFRRLKDITDWKKEGYRVNGDERREETKDVETYIVQRYLENPYLIGGKKFDLRVYVLVNSYVPLKAWLYRDGFARFSNTRFSLDSIDDSYVHLTNVAIQKTAPDYDPDKGCKWSLQQLRTYLTAKHGYEATAGSCRICGQCNGLQLYRQSNMYSHHRMATMAGLILLDRHSFSLPRYKVENMFRQMNEIFIKSLQSVQKCIINDKHCFELYGYDILVDSNLKLWLLEVNASPSLTASNQEDYDLKYGLLEDTLNIVDLEGRMTGKEKRAGGFDLMWNDGPIYADEAGMDSLGGPSYATNTFLGCNNDRKRQLIQLFRSLQSKKSAAV